PAIQCSDSEDRSCDRADAGGTVTSIAPPSHRPQRIPVAVSNPVFTLSARPSASVPLDAPGTDALKRTRSRLESVRRSVRLFAATPPASSRCDRPPAAYATSRLTLGGFSVTIDPG